MYPYRIYISIYNEKAKYYSTFPVHVNSLFCYYACICKWHCIYSLIDFVKLCESIECKDDLVIASVSC